MTCLQSTYKLFCCINDAKFPTPYNFGFEAQRQSSNAHQFQSNYIRTSKYRWYDFLIKATLLQYTRIANVYFLMIGILSSIPAISPVSSVTIWAPIAIVLGISIIRQGYQDYKRYCTDQELNHKMKSLCFSDKGFVQKQWSQIKIGNVIKVLQNEFFPADLILIASSEPTGNAFIQTSSLDGEKSLKIRKAYTQTNKYNCEQLLTKFKGQWLGVEPDKDMHRFSSKMKFQQTTIQYEGDKQFLYRGAKLKNTQWIYGLVIYTGKNTKIMMNMDVSHNKISQIQKKLNRLLILIFCVQMTLCIIPTILYGVFRQKYQSSYYYIEWPSYTIGEDSVLMFFSYFILMSTFIPISLVISLEFVKVFQGIFIDSDRLMYSQERKQGVTVKTVSLNEELGQIQYVFSDKTGTLTKNQMEFKIALIGDYVYGDEELIKKCDLIDSHKYILKPIDISNLQSNKKKVELKETLFLDNDRKKNEINTLNDLFQQFFQLLSMTHEVLLQKTQNSESIYRGPSPDELALVNFAKDNKFEFVDSAQSVISIKVNDRIQSFELLETFSFTSDRKRMSIVFRDSNKNIRLYIKGADNVIKERMNKKQVFELDQKVDNLSSIGLRTLLVATRIISEDQYKEFKRQVSLLEGKGKQQKYAELVSKLEQNLILLGATAILDKLQDMVPQTIKDLLKANIKIWMLTGDKLETAENIAKSCNLIQKDFNLFKLSTNELTDLEKNLDVIDRKSEELAEMKISNGLIMEGVILSHIMGNEQLQDKLVNIFQRCEAVICCRLLPLQKAQVVNLIKMKTGKIVLSIGDGQNDVPMIKAANIGIGLFGEEGMGAVQASDYGMPEFRMLRRLILVHGRWNYIRISDMILYFFYKNIIFTIPRLIYGFYSGFSTQRVFDDVYVALYNAVFTALPLVVRAVLQQDINYVFPTKTYINGEQFQQIEQQFSQDFIKTSIYHDHPQSQCLPPGFEINKYFYKLFPKIYFVGQENCIFNTKRFLYWTAEALVIGTFLTVIAIQIFAQVSINDKGWSSDLWLMSLNLYSGLLLIVTLKLAAHTKFWSWVLVLSILITTFGLYISYMWFSNYKAILSDHILGTTMVMWKNIKSLFFLIFCCCLIMVIDGILVTIDFHFGEYASKMRLAVFLQQEKNKKYLKSLNLPISQTKQDSLNDYQIQHEE